MKEPEKISGMQDASLSIENECVHGIPYHLRCDACRSYHKTDAEGFMSSEGSGEQSASSKLAPSAPPTGHTPTKLEGEK